MRSILVFGAVIGILVLLAPFVDTESLTYFRLEKFTVFLSANRLALSCAAIIFTFWVTNTITCPGKKILLYPTNLFLFLFTGMILPGVILTSDESTTGSLCFYQHVLALLAFLLGTVMVRAVSSPPQHDPRRKTTNSRREPKIEQVLILIFALSYLFCLTSPHVSTYSIRSILDFVSTGTVSDVAADVNEHRSAFYSDGSRQGLIAVITSYLMSLVLPLVAAHFLQSGILRKNRRLILCGSILFALTLILLAATGSRLRTMFCSLYLLVAITQVWPLSWGILTKAALVALAALLIQTAALGRMRDQGSQINNIIGSLSRVAERVLLAKGSCSVITYQYIPAHADFKHGGTYLADLKVRASKSQSLAQEVFAFIYDGTTGTAGPQAFAEGYANFGTLGILVVALVLGISMQSCTLAVSRGISRGRFLPIYAYATLLLARTGYGALMCFKTNGMHVLIIIGTFSMIATKLIVAKRDEHRAT